MKANSFSEGNMESLGDELSILEPEDTPFTSMVRKTKATSTFHEVFADTLRPARTSGTREGKGRVGGSNKAAKRQRFGCRQHRVFEEWSVTDVQQDITRAGGNAVTANEADLSFSKAMRELKRDMEATNLGNQEAVAGGDDEMQTRGFFKWVQSTAQAVDPVPADFRPPTDSVLVIGNSPNTLTETAAGGSYSLNKILKSMKGVYGKKVKCIAFSGDDIVEMIDNFTRTSNGGDARYNVMEQSSSHEISLYVTVFESSFARMEVVPDQFVNIDTTTGLGNARSAAIVVPEYWELAFLETLTSKEVEDDGGGPSGWIRGKFALCCKNPKGQGAIKQA